MAETDPVAVVLEVTQLILRHLPDPESSPALGKMLEQDSEVPLATRRRMARLAFARSMWMSDGEATVRRLLRERGNSASPSSEELYRVFFEAASRWLVD
jgi:hypothetical protein